MAKIRPNSIQLHAEVEVDVEADTLGVQVDVFERLTDVRIEIEGEGVINSKKMKFDRSDREY